MPPLGVHDKYLLRVSSDFKNAYKSPGSCVKMQILVQWVLDGTRGSAFLASSCAMLVLVVRGPL